MRNSLKKQLVAGIAGELSAKQMRGLGMRLENSPSLAEKWCSMRALAEMMTSREGRISPAPPPDLTDRVMSRVRSLPAWPYLRHTGWKRFLVPFRDPEEAALALASTGVFFLFTGLGVLLRLFFSPLAPGHLGPYFPLSFLLAFLACALLLLNGLLHFTPAPSPPPSQAGVWAAVLLFGLTAATGLGVGEPGLLSRLVLWYGISGQLLTAALGLCMRLTFPTTGFIHAKIPCSC